MAKQLCLNVICYAISSEADIVIPQGDAIH